MANESALNMIRDDSNINTSD